jgi:putative DNA primase/helicase
MSTPPGRTPLFVDPEPWPEPVDGVTLLNELASVAGAYVVLPEGAADALALWIVHTYAVGAASISPRLCLTSPEKGCGKTTALDVLNALTFRPLPASNISPAAVYRTVEKYRPTLLIDEADTFVRDNPELRGILNSGHARNGNVVRCVGDNFDPHPFPTFSAVAIALIGELPSTLADRAIHVKLRRRLPSESIGRLRQDRLFAFEPLRRQAARWVSDNADALGASDPAVPEELFNRAADNWRALLAIADAVGGEWPARARRAALLLSAGRDEGATTPRIQLLADLRELFREREADRLTSAALTDALAQREERPWPEWNDGRPITPRQLAKLLAPFGIHPKTIRFGEETAKGYDTAQFADAFARYLPAESVTPSQSSKGGPFSGLADPSHAPSQPRTHPSQTGPVTDGVAGAVTDRVPRENPHAALTVTDVTVGAGGYV